MLRERDYVGTAVLESPPVAPNRRSPDYIRWVQRSLNRLIGSRLAVDGAIGRQTRDAVRAFQQRRGLPADGVVGPATERALIAAGAGQPPAGAGPAGRPGPAPAPPGPRPATLAGGIPPVTSGDPVVLRNAELARSMGWDIIYGAIAGWILGFREVPTLERFTLAVADWQRGRGLPVTRLLDAETWRRMLADVKSGLPRPRTPEGVERPHRLAAVMATFGDPTVRGWEGRNLVVVRAPAGQTFSGRIAELRVHRLLAPQFDRLFRRVHEQGLWSEIVPSSGTYLCRTKKSYGKKTCGTPGIRPEQLSTHSWGISIDVRARDYPFIESASQRPATPPLPLLRIFQEHGFHFGMWFMRGGLDARGRIDFRGADPMHFQFATGF